MGTSLGETWSYFSSHQYLSRLVPIECVDMVRLNIPMLIYFLWFLHKEDGGKLSAIYKANHRTKQIVLCFYKWVHEPLKEEE